MNNIKQKYLLVLGGSHDQLFLLKKAKLMGYKTICLDKNKVSPAKRISDIFLNVDFSNISNTKKKIQKYKKLILGVITMGSDNPLIVSKLSNFLKIKNLSNLTAKYCQDKLLMKKIFNYKKILNANYIYTKDTSEIKKFYKKIFFKPLIVKPRNLAGSKGVFLIKDINELENILIKLRDIIGKKKKFIVEEFLEGNQISTETIISNNKIYTLGFADRNYEDTKKYYPQIIENGGTVPSKNKRYIKPINKILAKLAKAINFNNGVIKGDFVVNKDKIKIIEFAGRLSGGDFCESLVPFSTGRDYVKYAIDIACEKKKLNIPKYLTYKKFVKNRYFFLKPGKLNAIKGLRKIKKIKGLKKILIEYKIGSKIINPNSHGSRAGVFVVEDNNLKSLNKKIDKIYSTIKFKIDDKYLSGDPRVE
tara:strand:+ start:814 stop:2070 length:1257 start_codon:yes stop_codon:yes gene_type:complete